MSIAKIHAFTGWLNFRLNLHSDNRLNDVMTDLFHGEHWKHLIESYTGQTCDRVGSFNNISQVQKSDRIEYLVKELKAWNIIDEDCIVKSKSVAARSSVDTLSFLNRLVAYDTTFLWKRMEYLQQTSNRTISQYPFSIYPVRIKDEIKEFKKKRNILGGLGDGGVSYQSLTADKDKIAKFEFENEMLQYKPGIEESNTSRAKSKQYLITMLRNHFKLSKIGKNVKIERLTDLNNMGILCTFINVLIPNTCSTEVLPNDQWSINLILKSIERIVGIETDFDAADLNSGDQQALSVYFITLLAAIYKTRQMWLMIEFEKDLNYNIRKLKFEIELVDEVEKVEEKERRIESCLEEKKILAEKFNLQLCRNSVLLKKSVLEQLISFQRQKIKERYEIVNVRSNTNVSDLCRRLNIYLLPGSNGFYQMRTKELVSDERRIILQQVNSGEIICDTFYKCRSKVRSLLKFPLLGPIEINPRDFLEYEIFVECNSRAKSLTIMDRFLYKVFEFDSFSDYWIKMAHKAARENDFATMENLVKIFLNFKEDVLWTNRKDGITGNTVLHCAVEAGNLDMVMYLLEFGFCDVNARNKYKMSPLFLSVLGMNEKISGILLEWGADINITNIRKQTALECCLNDALKEYIIRKESIYTQSTVTISQGDLLSLESIINDLRVQLEPKYLSLRSRCVNGSTLLHTAGYFGSVRGIKDLLMMRIDVNLRDYQGATALHRTKDVSIIQLLLEAGIDVNLCDNYHNSPLHAACYGESTVDADDVETSIEQMAKAQLLLDYNADPVCQNEEQLLPIHCAAWQGRWELIELLLSGDVGVVVREAIQMTNNLPDPPSLAYQSIYGGHVKCALKLLDSGFNFKPNEATTLIKKLITRELSIHGNQDMLEEAMLILIQNSDIQLNSRMIPDNQTVLHWAAAARDFPEMIDFLLKHGSDVNVTDGEHCTALFDACKNNNIQVARILILNDVNITAKNKAGLTAFDYIGDYQEWIDCELFDFDIVARLKAYKLKQARNMLRNINRIVNHDAISDTTLNLRQLECRLDESLMSDFIERSKSQLTLRARSVMY